MTDQTPTTEEHATVRLGTEIQRYAEGFPHSDFARVSDALATHDRAVKAEALREVADEVRQGTGLYRCRLCAREYDVLEGRIGKFNYCFPDDTTQQNCLGMILSSI